MPPIGRRSARLQLAPRAPEGYLARGFYHARVSKRSCAAHRAPITRRRSDSIRSSSAAVGALTGTDASAGLWGAACRARATGDRAPHPRSARQSVQSRSLLLWLRRYPEAQTESERGLVLAPGDLELTEDPRHEPPWRRRSGWRQSHAARYAADTRPRFIRDLRRQLLGPLLGARQRRSCVAIDTGSRSLRQRSEHLGLGAHATVPAGGRQCQGACLC